MAFKRTKNKYLLITPLCITLWLNFAIASTKNSVTLKNQPTQVLQIIAIPETHYEVGMGFGEMAPNTTKNRRIQLGPEMVYVLQGELILILEGQPEKVIKKGESFQILANVPHETKAGPKGAKFLATWVVEQKKQDQFVVPIK